MFRAKNQNQADMGSVAGALLKKVVGGNGEGEGDIEVEAAGVQALSGKHTPPPLSRGESHRPGFKK